ncbi:aspartate/glutamate racemase family protein [Limnoraphis robusta]|uniref:Amino acid racemase n=1 Tax=Limnoraphis robusta CCNP1315 TaxID=3110306 RepID=A0ABU5U573_9CYAN|nr:amino acid racemase [Limnoraphis robusta]MEA5522338.1 amino acid racemase [Limnoraphis robusta CCNP1315]
MHVLQNFLKSKPIITIIGGAGPDAAIDLQLKLSLAMKKKLDINSDQDYYRVIIDNNSEIPNRDKALLSNGSSPLDTYINSAKKLEEMGGNILIISCNTAHTYFNDIQKITSMKAINMIEETASFFCNHYTKIKKVGLLSTCSTIQANLYHNAFDKYQVKVIIPNLMHQNNIVQAIYGIKAGFISNKDCLDDFSKAKLHNIYQSVSKIKSTVGTTSPKKLLLDAVKYFEQEAIEAVILGCTEIPLALNRKRYIGYCTLIDPTEILANATIDYAMNFNN